MRLELEFQNRTRAKFPLMELVIIKEDFRALLDLNGHGIRFTTQSSNTLQKFYQTISEPSPKAPNLVLNDLADLVRSMFTTPPSCIIQIHKEKKKKKEVSGTKRDLFSWQILFQPELGWGEPYY